MSQISRRAFLALAGSVPFSLAGGRNDPQVRRPGAVPGEHVNPWLEIDTASLAWNVRQVRQRVGGRPIMAVVKCNAYGHGLAGMAGCLAHLDIRHFAVVTTEEALILRDSGIEGMILNFGAFSAKEAEVNVRHDISQSVYSKAVESLAAAARRLNIRARVHIKVDTGLGRVGVPYLEALPFIERVAAMPEIFVEGIFTTLTEDDEFDPLQVQRLSAVCRAAEEKGISPGLRHAASSAAVSRYPGAFLDMVRPGDCLYGLEPLPNLDPRPVMSLKTRVVCLKTLRPGETLGYHRVFKVERDMRVATLPLGYSDGYPFRAVGRAEVLIRGRRWPLIAYMSANHCAVDVTGGDDIGLGDEAVLFGEQDGGRIDLTEVADRGESTVYKVAIGMNPRLPRFYL